MEETITVDRQYLRSLDVIERELEYLIGSTPTGDLRNKLTVMNIDLMIIKSEVS